jgi:hypothetical protein
MIWQDGELERIKNEAVMACGICLEGLRKTMKID